MKARLVIKSGKAILRKMSASEWKKTYRKLLKSENEQNPVPDGFSRREWQKLHKLPRPYKMKGGPPYTKLSRRWWDGFSIERQREFHKLYPEPKLRKLFPINSKRRARVVKKTPAKKKMAKKSR